MKYNYINKLKHYNKLFNISYIRYITLHTYHHLTEINFHLSCQLIG